MIGPETLLALAAICVGLVSGNVLNLILDNIEVEPDFDVQLLKRRCKYCRETPSWRDIAPVQSWFRVGRPSRCCHSRIGPRRFLVELISGTLAVVLVFAPPSHRVVWDTAFHWQGAVACAFHQFFVLALLGCSVASIENDMQTPSEFTHGALGAGLIGSLVVPGLAGTLHVPGLSRWTDSLLYALFGVLAGMAMPWVLRIAYMRLRREEGMSVPIIWLMGGAGAYLGGWDASLALMLASSVASVTLAGQVTLKSVWKGANWPKKVGLVPFLCGSSLVFLFFGDRIREVLFP